MTLSTRLGNHEHAQTVASDSWVIKHDLGYYPVVSVFLNVHGEVNTVLPYRIEHPSKDTCIIKFTQPRVGNAHLT